MNSLITRKVFKTSTTYLRISSNLVNSSIINKPNILLTNYSTDNNNSTHLSNRIQKLINNNKVVVFMKGVPDQPMCGFSNAVVQILRMHEVDYDAHNILEDEELRSGIKKFSDWPTIPQIYINKEFVGGCDIFLQMHQNGELIEEFNAVGIRSALLDKDENK